jgi:hypothetical protein
MVVPNGKHWAYAHDPELAPVVREMVARVLSGVPMRQIRIWLNELGIPTPRNAARRRNGHTEKAVEWSTQSVKEVLTNPAIYGVMTENGKPLRDSGGEVIHRCEGIIDRQEWERVKRAISHPGHTYRVDANPLLGIAFCHLCGEPLYTTSTTGRRGTKYEYYRCARAKRDGDCPSKNIPSVPLIQRAVEIFLGQTGKLEWGHWKVRPAEDHGYEIAEVKQELADLDDEYAVGRLHKTTYARMTHRLEERLETLQELPSVPESEEFIGQGITYTQRFTGLTEVERAAEMREAGFKLFVSQTDEPDGFTVRFQIRDFFFKKARKS